MPLLKTCHISPHWTYVLQACSPEFFIKVTKNRLDFCEVQVDYGPKLNHVSAIPDVVSGVVHVYMKILPLQQYTDMSRHFYPTSIWDTFETVEITISFEEWRLFCLPRFAISQWLIGSLDSWEPLMTGLLPLGPKPPIYN